MPNASDEHKWAKHPDWDKFVAKATRVFLEGGGTIKYIKPGKMTTVDEKGNVIESARRKGRTSVHNLPPMSAYQKQTYYKLRKECYTRDEALEKILGNRPKQEGTK